MMLKSNWKMASYKLIFTYNPPNTLVNHTFDSQAVIITKQQWLSSPSKLNYLDWTPNNLE